MKLPLLASSALVLLVATASMAPRVQASAAILRCQSRDGTLVYTDKSCSAFGATAAPMPGPLLTRIAHEEAREQRLTGIAVAPATGAGAAQAPARRAPSDGCARSPAQLERDVLGAIALGDVNRLAESYHWVGMTSREGNRVLDRLQRLLDRPVADSHYFGAQIAAAGDGWASAQDSLGGDGGMLQLLVGAGESRSAVDFKVHRYAGCYFVAF